MMAKYPEPATLTDTVFLSYGSTPVLREPEKEEDWQSVFQWVLKNKSQCARFVLDGKKRAKTTILHKALASKPLSPNLKLSLVQSIIRADSRAASVVDSNGSLPLHVAVRNKAKVESPIRNKIVKILLDAYSAALLIPELEGCTPLHITCEELPDSEEDVKKLLVAAPNASRIWNATGSLPIHIACSKKCSVVVLSMLLNAYPDSIDVSSISGDSPLETLKKSENPDSFAIKLLEDRLNNHRNEINADLECSNAAVMKDQENKEESQQQEQQIDVTTTSTPTEYIISSDEDEGDADGGDSKPYAIDTYMPEINEKKKEELSAPTSFITSQASARAATDSFKVNDTTLYPKQQQQSLLLSQHIIATAQKQQLIMNAYSQSIPGPMLHLAPSKSSQGIIEKERIKNQILFNNEKQTQLTFLQEFQKHLTDKTSQYEQVKTIVVSLKDELDRLKAQKRKQDREKKENGKLAEKTNLLSTEVESLKEQLSKMEETQKEKMMELKAKYQKEEQEKERIRKSKLDQLTKAHETKMDEFLSEFVALKENEEFTSSSKLEEMRKKLRDAVRILDQRQDEIGKLRNMSDVKQYDLIIEEQRRIMTSRMIEKEHLILDHRRKRVKDLEAKLLAHIKDEHKRNDILLESKRNMPNFGCCSEFSEHQATVEYISLLKYQISKFEGKIDELLSKAPLPGPSHNQQLLDDEDEENHFVDVVNVIHDDESSDDGSENEVDGIRIHTRTGDS